MAENEHALVERIKADSEESCGSCTGETKAVVGEAVSHLLSGQGSDDFLSALEEYQTQLNANEEDTNSRRHAQRIMAARKRMEGVFFLEDRWGKKLNEWIDVHKEAVPLISALDDLYRLAPKSKPTKKWRSQVDDLFERYSENAVLEFLRLGIGLLVDTGEVSVRGVCYDNEEKLKAMVLILAANRHEQDATLLRKLATVAYKKVPDLGPVSTAVGNVCLQALCDVEGMQGLVQLSELASQLKYPANAASLAQKRLEDAAKARGVSVRDLENMTIPDYGLSD